MTDLEPLEPADGVEMYLSNRRSELSEATLRSHRYRLDRFVEWCDREGVSNLNVLTGRMLHEFKTHRQDVDGLRKITLQGQLSTLRKFMEFCASIEAVQPGLSQKIILPSTSKSEESRDSVLEPDHAEAVLTYLDRFRYASRDHVIVAFAWEVSARLGGIRAPDVDDYDSADRVVELRHRPESDTPLKNKSEGERDVSLSVDLRDLLDDYLEYRREDVVDEFGRRPLFTTLHGRIARTTVRNTFYRVTRPCNYGECPHDREPSECEATNTDAASRCPSSVPPHDTRRGSITEHKKTDLPSDLVGERVDATSETIQRHYDKRSHRERMEKRRRHLEGQ